MDVDRLLQEIDHQQLLFKMGAGERAAFQIAVKSSVANGLVNLGAAEGWRNYSVQHCVVSSDGREVTFVARLLRANGRPSTLLRMWCVAGTDGWLLYDWRDLAGLYRMSTEVAMSQCLLREDAGARAIAALQLAARAADSQRFDIAASALQGTADVKFPPVLRGVWWTLAARVRFGQGELLAAKACLTKVEELEPESAIVAVMRASLSNAQGEYDKALDLVQRAKSVVGDDARLCQISGDALAGLRKADAAKAAYKEGLDLNPDSDGNLLGLCRTIPGDPSRPSAKEIAARFAKVSDTARLFGPIMESLIAAEDLDGAAIIADQYEKLKPGTSEAVFYRAKLKASAKDYIGAAAILRPLLTPGDAKGPPQALMNEFLNAMLSANKPVEAYQQVAQTQYAFGFLGDRLLATGDFDNLSKLVELHRQKVSQDPWVFFYLGRMLMLKGRYEEAEKVLIQGTETTKDEDIREHFRNNRVECRIKAGRWMSAYKEILPHRVTFDQLARYMAEQRNAENLVSLVAAHRENDPDDPSLGLWAAETAWIAKDYQAVVDRLTRHEKTILTDAYNIGRFEDRLVRSLVALKRFEEALERAEKSTVRDGDPWFEAVVYAGAGRAEQLTRTLARCVDRGYGNADFYADPDIGPALKSPSLRSVLDKYPEPSKPKE